MGDTSLARVLFQTALDLAEERQGGLLVVVADPGHAIGRLIAPHDVLEVPGPPATDDAIDAESPARPFSLFGVFNPLDPVAVGPPNPGIGMPAAAADAEPLSKRSIHYLARGRNVTELDAGRPRGPRRPRRRARDRPVRPPARLRRHPPPRRPLPGRPRPSSPPPSSKGPAPPPPWSPAASARS